MAFSMKRFSATTAGIVLALTMIAPVFAHHGWGWTRAEWFELSGTVTKVYVGNPHVTLEIESGGQAWHVDLAPLARTLNAGFNEDTLELGDAVTLIGHRAIADDVFEMKAVRVITGDEVYDVYPGRAADYDSADA